MKTLIILHGWQSSKEKWQKTKEELEKSGIRVFIPDVPGFRPETTLLKPWDLNDYLDWFKNYIGGNFEPNERFFLLGHSFGGRLAIKIASQNPSNAEGIILVSAAGIKKPKSLDSKIFEKLGRLIKFLRIEEIPLLGDFFLFLKRIFYRYILGKTDYIEISGFLKETFKNVLEENLKPLLGKISLPTLIIWGKEDKITPLSDAYLMKEEIVNSEIKLIENAGHAPYLQKPEELAKIIADRINAY